MSKTILVTGGLGYIGSHTVVYLQQAGYNVVIIDNLSNSSINTLYHIRDITGILPKLGVFNLCDCVKLAEFIRNLDTKIDAVIHFAAIKSVPESVLNPILYYHNNLVSTLNLLHCMKMYKIKSLVFSSSCSVYGNECVSPVTEGTPLAQDASSPYANTKKLVEDIFEDVVDINKISLRYFNPIGVHPSNILEDQSTSLVPVILTSIEMNRVLYVYGDDYDTKDGSCIRDYIDVNDLAIAHIKAIERLLDVKIDTHLEVYNIGTGVGTSVLEMINTFDKCGAKIRYEVLPRRNGDIPKIWADTTLACEKLGWKANVKLVETISRLVKHQIKIV